MKTADEMAKVIIKQRNDALNKWEKAKNEGFKNLSDKYEAEYFAIKFLAEDLEIEE